MTIPVDSIEIPERFVAVASHWYDGMGDMLYAVSSTGGLTIGTNCPVTDYTDRDDQLRKWYYSIWCDLSVDVGRALRAARNLRDSDTDHEDYYEREDEADCLEEFDKWVDDVCERLVDEYGLEDWEG